MRKTVTKYILDLKGQVYTLYFHKFTKGMEIRTYFQWDKEIGFEMCLEIRKRYSIR